jgi:hypothetical protein
VRGVVERLSQRNYPAGNFVSIKEGLMFRLSIVALTGLLFAACVGGVPAPSSTPATANSGIEGQALAGPTCPVERVDSPCPDRPVPNAMVDVWYAAHTTKILTFTTDDQGRFHVALAPGDYNLDPQRIGSQQFPVPHPQNVTVHDGQFTQVTIEYDTGIR